jgi:hypothetical protein
MDYSKGWLRVKTGAVIVFCALGALRAVQGQTATNDFYVTPEGSALTVPAPGVLTNDTGGTLTAVLVSGTANGTLTLNRNGAFVYTPTNNFTGVDGFTYRAKNGSQTSSVVTVDIMVLAPGELFYDNFFRPTNSGPIFPWVRMFDGGFVQGNWSISNHLMTGTSPTDSYGYTYYQNASWSNYMVQAQIQFSSISASSAGILGRLNPVTGAHYAVWIYPEGSTEQYSPHNGKAVLLLIKYSNWTNYTVFGYTNVLPGIGTSWHTLKLTFQTNNISTYFDGLLVTNITDSGSIDGKPAYTSGGIGLNLWTLASNPYTLSVDNVIVSTNVSVANNDTYNATNNAALQVPAPGILANDTGNGPLTAILVSNPANGSLTLTNNGGFTYIPTNGSIGTDSFTYQCTDGQTTSGVATVFITVSNSPPVANNDLYSLTANTTLNVGQPGVLVNDYGGSGPLTAVLAGAPADGSVTLTNNGGFSYAPATNFTGMDGFTYQATDGHGTSSVATAEIMVMPSGALYFDNFTRPPGNNSIYPWVEQAGTWGITNQLLIGTSAFNNYGYAYYENASWTDYSVQAQIRYSTTNAWGGAVGGRLNPVTGAHYSAWVFPEGSPWGPTNGVPAGVATLQIIKHETWTTITAESLVRLPGVGTNWHNVELAFQGSNVFAYFDDSQITNLADKGTFDGHAAFTNGGICLDTYTASPTAYTFSVSNVVVAPLVLNQDYSVNENKTLAVGNPGLLSGDTDVYGSNLTATLINGPTNGTLALSSNGGFNYTPATNFAGTDGFTIQATDKSNHLDTATAAITVVPVAIVPAPVILSYGLTNRVFTVAWSSVAGATYELQSTTNLIGASWISVSPNVMATGSTASQTDFVGSVPWKFYRAALLPQ